VEWGSNNNAASFFYERRRGIWTNPRNVKNKTITTLFCLAFVGNPAG
jgi:hypothetical protein